MRTFIFALLLAVFVSAYAATLTQLPETGFSRSDVALEITSVTPEFTSIRFHDPVFEIGELMFDGADYDIITVCSNGWLAFGNQSWNDCFRNFPLSGINSASNMVAAYWDDLKTSGPNQGVWSFHDTISHNFTLQWKASGGTNYSQADLDFQIILLDPEENPTQDGNGAILIQSNDVFSWLN